MKKKIDCFLIGENKITFERFEQLVRNQGITSSTYRDLNHNMIAYQGKYLSTADAYNTFCSDGILRTPIETINSFDLGIAYLGSYLHRHGYSFDYINSYQDEKEYLKEKLENAEILTIGILTTHYLSPDPIDEIIKFIKQYNKQVIIIVGGPFISTIIRSFEENVVDCLLKYLDADFYVNSAQGEATLVKLIQACKQKTSVEKINNIYFKSGGGYKTNSIEPENNILEKNTVLWELFADRMKPFTNIRTSISCPFSCSFCGFPQHAGEYQLANLEAIESELNRLDSTGKVKVIYIIDDTLNVPKKRFKDFLKLILKNKYSFQWHSHFRCQYADPEIIKMMSDAGCTGVMLGLESGNKQILENMNKNASIESYYNGISLLKENGILALGNFFIGFPGETEETVHDTVEFIKTADLDYYRVQPWYFEHITPIFKEKEKYGLSGGSFNWRHNTMDTKKAMDIIENIILTLEGPVRFTQYYFCWDDMMQLPHKGITRDQVKLFLKAFDNGVRERLKNPGLKGVSPSVIQQIKKSCLSEPVPVQVIS